MSEHALMAGYSRELPDASEWTDGYTDLVSDYARSEGFRLEIRLTGTSWIGRVPKAYPKVVFLPDAAAVLKPRYRFAETLATAVFSVPASVVSFMLSAIAIALTIWQVRAGVLMPLLATTTAALCFGCIGISQFVIGRQLASMSSSSDVPPLP